MKVLRTEPGSSASTFNHLDTAPLPPLITIESWLHGAFPKNISSVDALVLGS